MALTTAGVDLGGKTTGRTATAIAESSDGPRPRVSLLRDDAEGKRLPLRPGVRRLTNALVASGVELVAIDAPLSLPHPVVCEDVDCSICFPTDGTDADYTSRTPDHRDTWTQARFTSSPMSTAILGALTMRGIYLRRSLEHEGVTVIETWPRGVYMSLKPDAQNALPGSSGAQERYVATMLAALSDHVDVADDIANADEVDAVAVALAAWSHDTTDEPRHLGGPDGEICLCTSSRVRDPKPS